jgi:hypothetical protein
VPRQRNAARMVTRNEHNHHEAKHRRTNVGRIVVHSQVGPDGVLHLTVPVGAASADREVEVTIEVAGPKDKNTDQEEWRQFVLTTAGAWQGELQRPDQGDYERRDELP